MRALITGGAGCLGSNLIEHWLPQGHQMLVIDNFATGKREAIPPGDCVTVIEGSIADKSVVDSAFDRFKPTHVVHLAASYKDPNDWIEDAQTNVIGTIHLTQAAQRHQVSRFINFQTVLCYGKAVPVPIPVDHPLRPFTSYGISKVAGESAIAASGLPFASLRLANVVAPRLAIGPIPAFYKRLKTGQGCFCTDATRDFLDMSDFFSAVELLLRPGAPSGIFNVSSGEGHTIAEIYHLVRAHLKLPPDPQVKIVPVGEDDVAAVVPDPRLTEKVLGWRAKVSFSETIDRMLSWYDAHGVTDIYSHLTARRD